MVDQKRKRRSNTEIRGKDGQVSHEEKTWRKSKYSIIQNSILEKFLFLIFLILDRWLQILDNLQKMLQSEIKISRMHHTAATWQVCVPAQAIKKLYKIKYLHVLICFFSLVSQIFNIIFNYIVSCTITHNSNVTSLTP